MKNFIKVFFGYDISNFFGASLRKNYQFTKNIGGRSHSFGERVRAEG